MLLILPIISFGFVNNLSTVMEFCARIISDPKQINKAIAENNTKFNSKAKFPLFISLLLFA